ncbi:signal recognition particle 9 kDa protein-like [Clavelina lepadiformis]|uniref:Signal recognition particle 9 kDa protein n=1 Tax=Clavelina lepadiformis TaxID=159417 RepID=A0ABP0FKQ6_CLALP
MTYIESWEEFCKAAERLYQSDPSKVRYNIKYRHCDEKLVLTVTDDQVRLQYATEHAQDVKKVEKFTSTLLRLMVHH